MTNYYQQLYKQLCEQKLHQFQNLMQIHTTESLSNQYFESQYPLSIQECTNDPTDPQKQYTIALYAPGNSFQASFGAEIFQENTTPHMQNYCTLTYVTRGNLYKNISGKRMLYPAGSCFLLNRGTSHTENFDTEYQTLNLAIRPEFIAGLRQCSSLFPSEGIGEDVLSRFISQKMEQDEAPQDYISFTPVLDTQSPVEQMMRQMMDVMTIGGPGASFLLQYLFCVLLSYLEDPTYYHMNHFKLKGDASAVTFSRITHMLEDSHGRITREEMEKILQYDGSYLSRIVKQHAGMSLTDYRMTFRMETARRTLKYTDKSISEILQELGCSNRTFFCRMFKEHYGMTPTEYRKKHRK